MLLKWGATITWAAILGGSLPTNASPTAALNRKSASLSSVYVQAHIATSSDIDAAHQLIEDALSKEAELNTARVKSPARNHFAVRPSTHLSKRGDGESVPPLLEITDELAAAASLLATLESSNSTVSPQKRGGGWWMGSLDHKGSVPLGDDSSYKVFQNVVDYGADPSGGKVRLLVHLTGYR